MKDPNGMFSYIEMFNGLPMKETFVIKSDHSVVIKMKFKIAFFFRRAFCGVFGHKLIRKRWGDRLGKDYEVHEGCLRCPRFLVTDRQASGLSALREAVEGS